MSEFAGSRNSHSNVSDVLPVSNAIEIVVGTAETLLTNPDPSNWRRLILHSEGSDPFRARLGNYLAHVFLDGDVTVSSDQVAYTDHGYDSGDGPYRLTLAQAVLVGAPGVVISTSPDLLTRDAGSWLDEGFVPGQTITLGGSATNNGALTISSAGGSVTDLVIEVDDTLTPEATQTDLTLVAAGEALPTGLAVATNYYIERVDDDILVFHTTAQGAIDGSVRSAGTVVEITAVTAGGVHTIGGMVQGGFAVEPPVSSITDGYASFQLSGRMVLSAPKSITVVGSNSASVLTAWWTP